MSTITPNTANTTADLSAWSKKDPSGEAQFEKDLHSGNGNAATEDLVKAINNGDISQQQGADLGSQVQQYVNQGLGGKIGGKINGKTKKDLQNALGGTNVIKGGKTRATVHFENFMKGVGNFFQGLGSTLTGGLIPPPSSGTSEPAPATSQIPTMPSFINPVGDI